MITHYLSGYCDTKTGTPTREFDHRLFPRMDHTEAHDLHEAERQGCPLCLSSHPWEHHNNPNRRDDKVEGEGQLLLPGSDFRNDIDVRDCMCQMKGSLFLVRITRRDLDALPGILKLQSLSLEPVRGKDGEFVIRMSSEDAEEFGLTNEFLS